MATYYRPRRPSVSTSSFHSILLEGSNDPSNPSYATELQLTQLNLTSGEHSIYVFPNPSSTPPSPAGPLTAAGEFGSPSRPRLQRVPRRTSRLSRTSSSYVSPDTRTDPSDDADASTVDEEDIEAICSTWSFPSPSPQSAVYTPSSASGSFDLLETELSRILPRTDHRTNGLSVLVLQERTNRALAHMGDLAPAPPARITLDHAQRLNPLRARTHSLLSYVSLSSKASTGKEVAREPSPQTRLSPQAVPFLAFFARVLSLDLDDPVVHALEHPEAEEELAPFPGYSLVSRNHLDDHNDLQDVEEGYTFLIMRGRDSILSKLLRADPELSARRSLRKGLAIPLDLDFDFGSERLLRLLDVVGGAWNHVLWKR